MDQHSGEGGERFDNNDYRNFCLEIMLDRNGIPFSHTFTASLFLTHENNLLG